MKKHYTLILLIIVSSLSLHVFSQNKTQLHKVVEKTNVDALNEFAEKHSKEYESNKEKALHLAKQKGWVIRKVFEDGGVMELQGVFPNGKPLYYVTANAIAAETTSTDEVYWGGSAGLDLDGTDMIIGEWDEGDILVTHKEFNNTGISRVTDKDGVGGISDHATHVAGTIMAGGIEPQAKGMAYNANLEAYDWDFLFSEVSRAAADGLLISNHSHVIPTGWRRDGLEWLGDLSISSEEDFRFGFYGELCVIWDNIAQHAPYYLICKAAGNDRGHYGEGHPRDGGENGYDCIGFGGNAKNILTVGAVKDIPGGYTEDPANVKMTSFSSWGPCDDGRIKPDICGNGYNLYSPTGPTDEDYKSWPGTSMATPNVSGSLLMLQEHYFETQGTFMKAATLKALAIHTADECGPSAGPDYMFGWGLLNTKKAADVITNRDVTTLMMEEALSDGNSYIFNVTATGDQPLVVTLVWTDPAGTPPENQLDPTDIMLVNDLDLIVEDGSSTTYFPYKLDGQNPSNAATTGDNDVDNVEKVFIENPLPGIYTITVKHEGSLTSGIQDFSIIVSGISNTLPVVSTGSVINNTLTTADVSGEVVSDNGNPVTECGFVYNMTGVPTTSDNKVPVSSGIGVYSTTLNNLNPSTTYYVRAYAINSQGTNYGNIREFTTACEVISVFPYIQDFSENGLPNCWENVDNNGKDQIWLFTNPYGLKFYSSTASSGFALFDSYRYGPDRSQNTDLISPVFDFREYEAVELSFEHYYFDRSSTYSDMATLSYSVDGGTTWIDIQSWSGSSTGNAEDFTGDLSAHIAGQSNVKFKWNYTGHGFYWAIDDLEINTALPCSPPSIQSSDFNVDAIGNNDLTISWSRGDGDAVLVLAKKATAINSDPFDGVLYTANATFGSGDEIGLGNYVIYNGTGTSVNVSGLAQGSEYYFELYEYNTANNCYLITPGPTQSVTTTGNSYCISFAENNFSLHLSKVTFESINNLSGSHGYADYTTISTDVEVNKDYAIAIVVSDASKYINKVYAWIDWNHDGDFEEDGESIRLNYNAVLGAFSANGIVSVPSDAIEGSAHMRIIVADKGAAACGSFQYGEVEDYAINVVGNDSPIITTGSLTNITQTSADLSGEVLYDNGSQVTERGFVYNTTGAPTTSDIKISVSSGLGAFPGTLSKLSPNQFYYVRAYAINSQGTAYGIVREFKTPCELIANFPYTQDFSASGLPGCWENIDNIGIGQVWLFNNPANRPFNASTASNGFAILDSDYYGKGNSQDADLITPAFDFSEFDIVELSFEHWYIDYLDETASLSYSIDGGATWIDIQTWSGKSTDNVETFSQFISAQVAGHSNVKFSWNYTGSYGLGWAIDDIEIYTAHCSLPTTQSSNFDDDVRGINDLSVSWARGDGDAVLVLARKGSPVDIDPINGVFYTANAAFGSGDEVGLGNFVVYNGTEKFVNIIDLQDDAEYHFAVYEYSASENCYLTPGLLGTVVTNPCEIISTFPYIQDFSSGVRPVCWENVDNFDYGRVWQFDNPGERTFNATTANNGFAILDNSKYGYGVSKDVDLITPVFDFREYNVADVIELSFEHYFNVRSSDRATVSFSVDGGSTWTDIQTWSGSPTSNAETFSIVISSQVAGQSNVKFKWNFTGSYSWFWAIDDIKINAKSIHTVAFNVTDGINPIANASIEIDGQTLTTNISGEATIDLVDGIYSCIVTADDYKPHNGELTVAGEDVIEKIVLEIEVCISSLDENEISIYPNPFEDEITIKTSKISNYRVIIVNTTGKVFYDKEIANSTEKINLSDFANGVYLMKVLINGKVYDEKIIKE